MSDQAPSTSWSAHPLLQRATHTPLFHRQAWDESKTEDFGPWRFSPKPDPLAGQTVPALDIEGSDLIDPLGPHATEAVEVPAHSTEAAPEGITQEHVDQLLEQARKQSWQMGHEAAVQQLTAELDAERQALRSAAQALNELQADSQRLLEPVKKLSLHIAQELVRGEMQLGTTVIERLIQGCIEALDQPAQITLIQVGHGDMHRLRDLNLPGITLELDETLSEGSVRAKVSDTQVQDLIEHRLSQIAKQILSGEA